MSGSDPQGRSRFSRVETAAICVGLGVLAASPAYAIPSPDLAVNFFANVAQLTGLALAALGGLSFGGRRRIAGLRSGTVSGSRAFRWALIALVGAFAVSAVVNVLQWSGAVEDQNRRLQTNLVRSSTEDGTRVGDTSLKTLAVSEQVERADGITTAQLSRILEQARSGDRRINLIDVREPEEREVGRIPGFDHVRYPDLALLRDRDRLKQRDNVLLCYSGNRSSELCDVLNKAGVPCRFVVGGYEKWVVDGMPVERPLGGAGDNLRGLPDYLNRETLLDTPEVTRMVRDDGALFVDVRYPGDFAASHLPGAINLPVRKMPTADLRDALKTVPHRPVVAPCYDKRSCFYAKVLGLRLNRLGYDYRGRYTVPHEFVATDSQAAAALTGSPSWFARAFDATNTQVAAAIGWMDRRTGSLFVALLIVVGFFRIIVLPFTAKSERDQVVLERIRPEIERLKAMRDDDPRAHSRELRALYRRHRLSPGFNVIGVLVQVPLFIVLFAAVESYARAHGGRLLWMSDASASDPYYVLPLAIGGVVFLHLLNGMRDRRFLAIAWRGAAAVGLAAITLPLSVAVNTYLMFSVFLMLLQAAAVRAVVSPAQDDSNPWRLRVAPLVMADTAMNSGGKATRLAQMVRAGLPVPKGFVITGAQAAFAAPRLVSRLHLALIWWRIGAKRVAVRSSGINEDGANRSYAGVFDTVLNVRRPEFFDALRRVEASMSGERAGHYSGEHETGAIVVQAMVQAEYAGVLFTRHPGDAASGLVEMVAGLGDRLVDGSATPESYRFGRASGQVLDGESPPIDLHPLVDLARRAEALFGQPQDVEWCYASGRYYLLQARDITANGNQGSALARELDRLIGQFGNRAADETVLIQNEVSEILPEPKPLSLSVMERLWAPGGSVEQAHRILGVPYDASGDEPYLVSVLGRLYVNRLGHERRFRRGPGPLSAFRIARDADGIERRFRDEFLPAFEHDMRVLDAIDPERLDAPTLLRLLRQVVVDFTDHHYARAHVINVAAEHYVVQATRALERRKLSAAHYLSGGADTVVHQGMELLARAGSGDVAARKEFLRFFGHRAVNDYELAEPRYHELPDLPVAPRPAAMHRAPAPAPAPDLPLHGPMIHTLIERAQRYQVLKEEAKNHCLQEVSAIRRLVLAIDRFYALDGGVFFLTFEEVCRLEDEDFATRAATVIRQRKDDLKILRSLPIPSSDLTPAQLETLGHRSERPAEAGADIAMAGSVVAGTPPVEGCARILDGEGLGAFDDGDILIVRSLHPDLVAGFGRVGGVVAENGGWLSHAAILAREYDVPTIVGVRGATERIVGGETVRMEPDGTITTVANTGGGNL